MKNFLKWVLPLTLLVGIVMINQYLKNQESHNVYRNIAPNIYVDTIIFIDKNPVKEKHNFPKNKQWLNEPHQKQVDKDLEDVYNYFNDNDWNGDFQDCEENNFEDGKY